MATPIVKKDPLATTDPAPMDFSVKSSDPNSILTKDQELNTAYQRMQTRSASELDRKNVGYAMDRGWKPSDSFGAAANAIDNVAPAAPGGVGVDTNLQTDTSGGKIETPANDPNNPQFTGSASDIENYAAMLGKGQEISAPGIDDIKKNLETLKNDKLTALEADYQGKVIAQKQTNDNVMAAWKAKMIKMGVPVDSSSFTSSVDAQESRNKAALDAIDREYTANKSNIEASANSSLIDLVTKDNENKLRAIIANQENLYKNRTIAKDIWQTFMQRDDEEKKREQQAYDSMLKFKSDMAKLTSDEKQVYAKELWDAARGGYFDALNKNTIKDLSSLEQSMPDLLGGLTAAASGGYQDRLTTIQNKQAQTENYQANTKETNELIGLKKQKLQADIANIQSEIAKRKSDSSGSGVGLTKAQEAYYKDVESGLKDLNSGRQWGEVWNKLADKYGIVTPEAAQKALDQKVIDQKTYDNNQAAVDHLDTLLNKNFWANPGAYAQQQKNTGKDKQTSVSFTIPE